MTPATGAEFSQRSVPTESSGGRRVIPAPLPNYLSVCSYRRLHVLLKREGQTVNHTRVYRIYRAEGLAVRRKARNKLAAGERVQKPAVSAANQRWSMDFMSDQLASGQRFRVLNVVDDFTRECLVMHVGTSITGADVARLLTTVLAERAQPAKIGRAHV